MDIFEGWENYEERIKENWENKITPEDLVVLAGDISWGLNLQETLKDFKFINNLPGQKLIMKGNHDYWWRSSKKIQDFWRQNGFHSLKLLHNNAYLFGEFGICGSRGWLLGEDLSSQKVLARETLRVQRSILAALELGASRLLVFLHYPPILAWQKSEAVLNLLDEYKGKIEACYYAHLHGSAIKSAFNGLHNEIPFQLISADSLNFEPLKIL